VASIFYFAKKGCIAMKSCCSVAYGKSISLIASATVFAVVVLGLADNSWSQGAKDKRFDDGIVWPEPKVIQAGKVDSEPHSDAIALFDGKSFDAWKGAEKWKVDPDGGTTAVSLIQTKEAFGDCQLHLEFATPKVVKGSGQGRGNNGVGFMQGKYEIQILDSYENPTYVVGQAAAVYNQRPPLVNASRKPGEWQTYDIVFEAPRFESDGKLRKPAFVTVFHNGVLVQNHTEIKGATHYDQPNVYVAHAEKLPLQLLYHNNPVRFRNIWIREIAELEGKKKQ
jgi:Domain of Unknown Function (DUF1080)